jgi:hypothetical protein
VTAAAGAEVCGHSPSQASLPGSFMCTCTTLENIPVAMSVKRHCLLFMHCCFVVGPDLGMSLDAAVAAAAAGAEVCSLFAACKLQ